MVTIEEIDTTADRRRFIKDFISFPKRLYSGNPYWVPWFDKDMKGLLGREHPFFEHSTGSFFLAYRETVPVGRIAVVHNTRYCNYQQKAVAHFCFIDFEDDAEVVRRLVEAAVAWAGERGLSLIEGPMFAGGVYGSGLLVEGFESPPPMTMMSYNYPYYERRLLEVGFSKWIDLYSAALNPKTFILPNRVVRVAELVRDRSGLSVIRFKNKRQIRAIAQEIGRVVNSSIGMYAEDYPLTEKEVNHLTSELLEIAQPDLIKILTFENRPVGFLFAFPDLSNALRKNNGRLSPFGIVRLLLEMRRADRLIINGMGILSEYQRRGGNALLYSELETAVREKGFSSTELVQISEQTDMMLKDLKRLGADLYKTYRMYTRSL